MRPELVYWIGVFAVTVLALNANYVRRRGFGKNPETWIGNLFLACAIGVLWPLVLAVVPGKLIVEHIREREERRRVSEATVEQLADEEVHRVR